ncbi:MAG: hypothetical protein IJ134_02850 [Bacilli bacterium]|nr:hypothetical protein [Bacilli bacterium]
MIVIDQQNNKKKYDNYKIDVSLDKFSVSKHNGKSVAKRIGLAPFITFSISDLIAVGLEMTYSKENLESMKTNENVDITEYISDILYADENGWISLNLGEYKCNITRINKSDFNIKLEVKEKIEEININVDSIVKIL